MKHPLVLVILDGWGHREETDHNAIALAKTPHYDDLVAHYPHTLIDASGHAVGLPAGLMGNSEVGHLNIGAGRVVYVGLTRIYSAIEDGSFFTNPQTLKAFEAVRERNSTLHLIGLVSDGGVHSHQDHLDALLEMAKRQHCQNVVIHAITDGRDTPPKSGLGYLQALENKIAEIGIGRVATVIGRFYAMDRDKRWERTELAYRAFVNREGEFFASPEQGIEAAYVRGETDEFLKPILLGDPSDPSSAMRDDDAVVFFNFRADRARQITQALTDPGFAHFKRDPFPKLSEFVCFGEYDRNFNLPVAFPPVSIPRIFAEEIARHGLKQLRLAETEKYAHVTFFFNGGQEQPVPGEDRILVPSAREVATYDLKPEMSAPEIGDRAVEKILSGDYDVIILNFANADMVGHSGRLNAAIRAVEAVDAQLGRVSQAVRQAQGTLIITADHGNCERMTDERGQPHTAHTIDWVPFMLISERWKSAKLKSGGSLADIAPTLLEILGLPKPPEMTGRSLLKD